MRGDVYDLPDHKLVIACQVVRCRADRLQLPFTSWEQQFVDDVTDRFRQRPHITWRQRRILRRLLSVAVDTLEHRVEFDRELQEALRG